MALPALMLEAEDPVEDRVARLEVNVEHIRADVSDIKLDLRRLNDKIDAVDENLTAKIDGVDQKLTAKIDDLDQRLTAKIDGVDQKLTAKIDGADQKLTAKIEGVEQRLTAKGDNLKDALTTLALAVEKGFADAKIARALDRVWWLLMSAALLEILARGLEWI
jgi:predicted  nucleic acid-binding Zn-ribbon protein